MSVRACAQAEFVLPAYRLAEGGLARPALGPVCSIMWYVCTVCTVSP